jgi:hypothetical protein
MYALLLIFSEIWGTWSNTPYKAAIPYKYIFATGVILFLSGVGVIVLSSGNKRGP